MNSIRVNRQAYYLNYKEMAQTEWQTNREWERTRPDTRLPQSRAVGQGLYFRSLDLGRSSEAKDRKDQKKVKCNGRTDGRTDGPTKRGVESCTTQLKSMDNRSKAMIKA